MTASLQRRNNGSTSANPTRSTERAAATGQLVQVATAKDHSLLLTSSGQVFSFGDNYYGQLGNATNANNSAVSANPDPTPVTLPGPAAQVAAGDQLSLCCSPTASSTLSAPTQRTARQQQQRRFDSQPDTDAGEPARGRHGGPDCRR